MQEQKRPLFGSTFLKTTASRFVALPGSEDVHVGILPGRGRHAIHRFAVSRGSTMDL